jgi:hypothetical protein
MQIYKRSLKKLKFLPLALIALICFASLAISEVAVIEKDLPAPFGGILLDDDSSSKILLDVQKLPILEES